MHLSHKIASLISHRWTIQSIFEYQHFSRPPNSNSIHDIFRNNSNRLLNRVTTFSFFGREKTGNECLVSLFSLYNLWCTCKFEPTVFSQTGPLMKLVSPKMITISRNCPLITDQRRRRRKTIKSRDEGILHITKLGTQLSPPTSWWWWSK